MYWTKRGVTPRVRVKARHPGAAIHRLRRDSARAGQSPPWAHGSPYGAGVSVIPAICWGNLGRSSPQGLPDLSQGLSLSEAGTIPPHCCHPGCGGGDAPYHPCSSVISVPIRVLFRLSDAERLRGTRTPTVTISTIDYRLSVIDYRLSPIAYRLSPIAYRLSATTFCSPAPHVPAQSRAPAERRCCAAGLPGSAPLLQPV